MFYIHHEFTGAVNDLEQQRDYLKCMLETLERYYDGENGEWLNRIYIVREDLRLLEHLLESPFDWVFIDEEQLVFIPPVVTPVIVEGADCSITVGTAADGEEAFEELSGNSHGEDRPRAVRCPCSIIPIMVTEEQPRWSQP